MITWIISEDHTDNVLMNLFELYQDKKRNPGIKGESLHKNGPFNYFPILHSRTPSRKSAILIAEKMMSKRVNGKN